MDRASGSLSNDHDNGNKNVTNKFAFKKNSVVIFPIRIKFQIKVLQTEKVGLQLTEKSLTFKGMCVSHGGKALLLRP